MPDPTNLSQQTDLCGQPEPDVPEVQVQSSELADTSVQVLGALRQVAGEVAAAAITFDIAGLTTAVQYGHEASWMNQLAAHVKALDDPSKTLKPLIDEWARVKACCSSEGLATLERLIDHGAAWLWLGRAREIIAENPERVRAAILASPPDSEYLDDLGPNFVKRSNCPESIVAALREAAVRRAEYQPESLVPGNRSSGLVPVLGERLHEQVLQTVLSKGSCSELVVQCLVALPNQKVARKVLPKLAKAVEDDPGLIVAAVEAGADPARLPGVTSAAEAVKRTLSCPFPLEFERIFFGNERFTRTCLADNELRRNLFERVADTCSRDAIFGLISAVERIIGQSPPNESEELRQRYATELTEALDRGGVWRHNILDDPQIRQHWGRYMPNSTRPGYSGYRHIDPLRVMNFLDVVDLQSKEPVAEGLKRRLVLTTAALTLSSEDRYGSIVADLRASIDRSHYPFPEDLLSRAVLAQQLSDECRDYVRAHPLVQLIVTPLLYDAGRLAQYESWGKLPEELRQTVVAATLFDSSLITDATRRELLGGSPHDVRQTVRLLLLAAERGFSNAATELLSSWAALDEALRDYLSKWVVNDCGWQDQSLEARLKTLPADALATAVAHTSRLNWRAPELKRHFVALLAEREKPVGTEVHPDWISYREPMLDVARGLPNWNAPLHATVEHSARLSGTVRARFIDDVIEAARGIAGSQNVWAARQRYESVKTPLRNLDNEKRLLLERSDSDPTTLKTRYASIQERKAEVARELSVEIRDTKARMLWSALQSGYISPHTGEIRIANHSWQWPAVKAAIESSSVAAEPGASAILSSLDAVFRSDGNHSIKFTISDDLTVMERLELGAKPERTCLYATDGHTSISLFALASSKLLRPIVMRGENGTPLARAVMILCRDTRGAPAILLERAYPSDISPEIARHLAAFAEDKGAATG